MTTSNTRCFSCKEESELTREHIIPQSIGGSLVEKLLCAECNSTFGQEMDAEISRQFGRYATHMQLKRARGKNQPVELIDDKTGIAFLFKDGVMTRKKPDVEVKPSDSGNGLEYAKVIATSHKELMDITNSIAKRYGVDPSTFTCDEVYNEPPSSTQTLDFKNEVVLRGIAKIAYTYACAKLPTEWVFSSSFDAIREYISRARTERLARANYLHTQFMVDNLRPLHRIHIALNRLEGLVIGYVLLFGCFRYTVLLAKGFSCNIEWPAVGYVFDPVQRIDIAINPLFKVPNLTAEQVLKPRDSVEGIKAALQKGFDIIVSHSDGLNESTIFAEQNSPNTQQ